MRSKLVALVVVGLAGCGGREPFDTGPFATCEDMGTDPISSIPVDEWPAGLDVQVDQYGIIPGIYTADACGTGPINVKLFQLPSIENVEVVTETVDPALECGCRTDEGLEGTDNALGAYAYASGAIGFFDHPGDLLDPAVDGENFEMTWAFLPSSTGYMFRGCGVTSVVGEYDAATVAIRIANNGLMSGTLEATGGDGEPYSCELTNFVLVDDEV